MTSIELKKAAWYAGAKDLLRVTESIRMAVFFGRPVGVVLDELRRNQPDLFGPPRNEPFETVRLPKRLAA